MASRIVGVEALARHRCGFASHGAEARGRAGNLMEKRHRREAGAVEHRSNEARCRGSVMSAGDLVSVRRVVIGA
jgi:hypothetical protein